MYWLNAIVPPRDADVMRYHLAHVRQIARDGAWIAVPDFHYAIPFGWTLNFLPYEMMASLRLPTCSISVCGSCCWPVSYRY